jgi:CubicO group peptidase (beta-lactamase class C family)
MVYPSILTKLQSELPGPRFSGLTIAGGKGRETLFEAAIGVADQQSAQSMTPRHRFPMASCSKPVTAAAIQLLVDEGALDWDQRVIEVVPAFRLQDASAAEAMTIRDLACHYSGLPPHTWSWVYPGCSRETFVLDRLPHLASSGPFREKHRYSNIGYAVLGYLIERVSGQPWETFVQKRILDPQGMHDTTFLDEQWSASPDLAFPHRSGEGIPFFHAEANHVIAPASEMMSTVSDLAKWMHQPPNPRQLEKQNLLRNDRKNEALGPLHYGLGWRLETFHGHPHVWHSGSCSGYSALMSRLPDHDYWMVLLSNEHGVSDLLRTIAYAWYREILDLPPHDFLTANALPNLPKQAVPSAVPDPYFSGTFVNPGYGTLAFQAGQCAFNGTSAGYMGIDQRLCLTDYDVSFVSTCTNDELQVHFGPNSEAIYFSSI